jgi:hypothetical protein
MAQAPDPTEHWRVGIASRILIVQDHGDDIVSSVAHAGFYDLAKPESRRKAEATAVRIAALPALERAVYAAMHALRSYEFGNASPDLAKSVADLCEAALDLAHPPPGAHDGGAPA